MFASSLISDTKCNHCAWISMKQNGWQKTDTFKDIQFNAVTANGIWHPKQLKRIRLL